MKVLLEGGADPKPRKHGKTALDIPKEKSHVRCVLILQAAEMGLLPLCCCCCCC